MSAEVVQFEHERAKREQAKTIDDSDPDATVLRDLDKLRAERGDVEIPTGETVEAAGQGIALSCARSPTFSTRRMRES